MKRICIVGGSGTGKTTLSNNLGEQLGLPVYHIDGIHHLPNWEIRNKDERDKIILEKVNEDKWIIDGTYHSTLKRRFEIADFIILEKIKINNIPSIIWGEKSNKVFIAVHGNMSNKEDEVIKVLAENATSKGYQVISFDLPEHGERKNDTNYLCKVQNCVKDLKQIIEYAKKNYTEKYNTELINQKIMGPNPLKLEEELMKDNRIKKGSIVMDLGSGQGITSVFLVKDYGFKVYATDLWRNLEDNKKFFTEIGLTEEQIVPIKMDATDLKYEKDFFDAVISADSYNHFGRNVGMIG